MARTTFTGPVRSLNGFEGSQVTVPVMNTTAATLALTQADNSGEIVTLNRAAGQAVTLPAAVGSGSNYRLFVGTTITSNSTTVKVANSTDTMAGVAVVANDVDASASLFETAADTDTITLNGNTTGGIKGCMIELIDVAAGLWFVRVTGAATGSEATPFSATV
jgi:hypothetical protein